jgi:phosphate transport system substrate-binding protein
MTLSLRYAFFASIIAITVPVSLVAQQPSAFTSSAKSTDLGTQKVSSGQKIVVITGARFSYKLVQKWIDDYNKVAPDVQIVIESRGSADPAKFDILAEVYEQETAVKKNREYVNVGRYAILPVATSNSAFAKIYSERGLTTNLINQIFFHDIFADKENEYALKAPFTVYTRLQRAGAPIVFTKYFGFAQKDIKGKTIAGSDEHLLKAFLRDSTGITYLPLPLIYDQQTKKAIEGLTVLPVDLNGNGKITSDEKFYGDLNTVIQKLESEESKNIRNVPIEYLHLSVDKQNASPEAVDFLKWVNENGQADLHAFGYLAPEAQRFEKEKFNEFASKRADK